MPTPIPPSVPSLHTCHTPVQGNEVHRQGLHSGTVKGQESPIRASWLDSNKGMCRTRLGLTPTKHQINKATSSVWQIRLWVQADNAVKEIRNSFTGRWASLLVQSGFFNVVAHHHLMVGHTHEDIGAGEFWEIVEICWLQVVYFLKWHTRCQTNSIELGPLRWSLLGGGISSKFPNGPPDAAGCSKDLRLFLCSWIWCPLSFSLRLTDFPHCLPGHWPSECDPCLPNQGCFLKSNMSPRCLGLTLGGVGCRCAHCIWFPMQHIVHSNSWLFTEIRDWCSLMPSGATLTNCYKLRKGDRDREEQWAVPQSFTFIAREGLWRVQNWEVVFSCAPSNW